MPTASTARSDSTDAPSAGQHLERGLSTRHITFIALGTAIGTGLFLGSASAIQVAGPAVLVAFALAGFAIFVVMRAMGEMLLRHPDATSFVDFTESYLGRVMGFVMGWMFALEMALVGVADVTAVRIYLGHWWPDVPGWIWMALVIATVLVLNLVAVRFFGETEFWLTLLKVGAIVAMIVLGIGLLISGAGLPGSEPSVSHLWEHGGFAPNGLSGIVLSLSIVAFAFGGIETLGMTVAETDDPERALPKAVNTLPWRIAIFYLGSIGVMLCLAPWTGITGENSPFVQVLDAVGLPAAGHVLNAVVIIAAFSALNAITYATARTLLGLARHGRAPRVLGQVHPSGVPVPAVLVVGAALVVGLVANIVWPGIIFLALATLASFATVFVWLVILAAHAVMRWRVARGELEPGAFPVPLWPGLSLVAAALLLVVFGAMGWSADTRPALVVGLVATVVLTAIGWVSVRARERADA
ncbi:histidine:proton symporter, AAT family [Kytococcus aerolatus]|uniref:Histidine:proton symporter, AAT family n=1 Tax=Kytococcus aerolatus TaxID=592308 RepID=A0A212TGW4_9MICO|nr:amino acid permease [Kytococcus aerolatus]SNC65066.1 histidine:proton symporter, AAT family [Kytococcus aerolatus]